MSKTKALGQRIAGKTKQAVGEIVGDHDLHEEGKAQAERGLLLAPTCSATISIERIVPYSRQNSANSSAVIRSTWP